MHIFCMQMLALSKPVLFHNIIFMECFISSGVADGIMLCCLLGVAVKVEKKVHYCAHILGGSVHNRLSDCPYLRRIPSIITLLL